MIMVDIVNEVSKIADITKVKAEVAVDAVFDAMRISMQRGERIELRGFGVFQVKPRKRGIGRNPRTGKEVRIPPGRTIRFKPGKDLQNISKNAAARRVTHDLSTSARFPSASADSNSGPFDPTDPNVFARAETWVVPPPARRGRPWVNAMLLVLTILTTTGMGALHYAGFRAGFGPATPAFTFSLFLHGLWYSATILAILGCHELGHYYACRYYRVDASLPYFLPAPILTGTLGAFIRIRDPIRSKRMLFDIGVAGPLAGFVIAVPALVVGLMLSNLAPLPPTFNGLALGEPLLFKGAAWLIWGAEPKGYALNLHPMAFAAWFGLLATALNLFPIGQLDGGHIAYAVLGRKSTTVTLASIGVAIGLTFFSMSWVVWTLLLVAMTVVMGPRHPRTIDEDIPLDRVRVWLAVLALVVFVLCFTPNPIEPTELLRQ